MRQLTPDEKQRLIRHIINDEYYVAETLISRATYPHPIELPRVSKEEYEAAKRYKIEGIRLYRQNHKRLFPLRDAKIAIEAALDFDHYKDHVNQQLINDYERECNENMREAYPLDP